MGATQSVWQGGLDYAKIAWGKVLKDEDKASIYEDVLIKFDNDLGDNNLLYHRSNTRKVTWNTNVGIVNHAQVTHFHWNLEMCGSPRVTPKKFSRSLKMVLKHVPFI